MRFFENFAVVLLVLFFSANVFAAVPTITTVSSSTADGTYVAGQGVLIQITFSESVTVSGGTPVLALNSGGSANYLSGSGSGTLDFNYVISTGQNTTDLNYSSTSALSAGGATIVAVSDGNTAVLTLPDGAGSLGENKNIAVDTAGPSCTITSPRNGTDYNSSTITGVTFNFSCTDSTGVGSTLTKISGNTVLDGNVLNWLTPNTSYTITIDANDSLGNAMTQVTSTFRYDTNAPSVTQGTSLLLPAFTKIVNPSITLSATDNLVTMSSDGNVALSCSASGPWRIMNYAATITDFNITSTAYGCSSTADTNKIIYARFSDKAGNWSTDVNALTGYDITAPSAPTGLSTSISNGTVTLTWTALTETSYSGIAGYKIYKSGAYLSSASSTTYSATGLTNGTSYAFKITAYDNAGNESGYSTEVSATPQTTTSTLIVKRNGVTPEYMKNNDTLNIECVYIPSATGTKIKYAYTNPTTTTTELKTSSNSVSSLTADFILNTTTSYGSVGFWCEATGAAESSKIYVTIDLNAPTISWTDTNNLFNGVKKVIVNATDNKLLDKIEIDFNNTIYAGIKDGSTNNYSIDLNTQKFENGEYSIKATAYDKAGNKTEISKTITIENTQSIKQKASKAIKDAKSKQAAANDLVNYFKTEALILPAEIMAKKTQGDSLLSEAENNALSDSNIALQKALNASALFDEFVAKTKTETSQTKEYVYDSNTLNAQIKSLGLNEATTEKISTLIADSETERKLKIIKVDGTDKVQVKIEVSFKNDSNDATIKIVEIIPKEIVDSASKIISETNFRIIKDDPIIEFTVQTKKGVKTTISYNVGEMSKENAEKIIELSALQKFIAPPLLFEESDKTEELLASQLGFFSSETILLIGIIGVLLLAILIIIIIFVSKYSVPKNALHAEKPIIEKPKHEQVPEPNKPATQNEEAPKSNP